jgi:g-D-glutamyl-meso-diaminopimelate peptidase
MEIYVRPNDSLWYYSQLFDISLILVEMSNPHARTNYLTIDEPIQIPGYVLNKYTVKTNESLWKIAIDHNLPVDSLKVVNPFINPSGLQVGQTLYVPQRVNEIIITDYDNYTYEKMQHDIQRLQSIYPFLFSQTIGKSVQGKDLIELQIGTGEKIVHLNGSFHANEWITTSIIMRFLNQYVLSLTNKLPIRGVITLPLFTGSVLSIVPMVNPDGVNLVLNGSSAAG